MDQSYTTHQRRPALIPAEVQLSPEDERAVRLRTGYVNPGSERNMVFNVQSVKEGHQDGATTAQECGGTKRKAKALEQEEEESE